MDSQKPKQGHAHTHGHADTQLGFAEAYCPSCEMSYTTLIDTCPNDGARLIQFAEEQDELTGRVLDDRFEIREKLGEGGMGTVYRALQTSVGRDVAVKVIHARLSRERATVKRFLREAKLSSRLSQMNTVVVHDFGQTRDGMLYLVMEQLQGQTLRAVVAGTGGLPLSRVKRIGIQLSDALHAAAELGIVHRDLKPSNIIILDKPRGRDRVKVLDFGLAKSLTSDGPSTEITKSGALMGTPLYMAPEVIAGEEATPQSDLYALGCILYEMVCGEPPFVGTSMSSLFAKHLTEKPAPLNLATDPDLEQLILSLLAKLPAERPSRALDVHARLGGETIVHHHGNTTRPSEALARDAASISGAPTLRAATLTEVRTQEPRRSPRLAVFAAVLVVAGGLAAWQFTRGTSTSQPTRPSEPNRANTSITNPPSPTQTVVTAPHDASPVAPAAKVVPEDAGQPENAAASDTAMKRRKPTKKTTRRHQRRTKKHTAKKPPVAKPPASNPLAKPPATKPPATTPPKLDFVD